MEHSKPDLPELLLRTHQLMHRYHMTHQRPKADEIDPRQGQGRLLMLLQRMPDTTQRDLGRMLNIRQQSLGELLMKLEKGGYITRRPDEKDRRTMLVHVTEKGRRQLLQKVDFTPVFRCLAEEEQAALADYLQRLITTLDDHLRQDGNRRECDYPCPPPPGPWLFSDEELGNS